MPQMRDVVRFTPDSVDELARSRRKRPGSRRPSSKVVIQRVDPRVWRTALKLAGGDARRIERESLESVVVHNRPIR